jgi:hypothetical protein
MEKVVTVFLVEFYTSVRKLLFIPGGDFVS